MSAATRLIPWLVLVLCAAYLIRQMKPIQVEGDYSLRALTAMPVSADGRVKPLDTVARVSLMVMSDRQTLRHDGRELPAIQWLLDVVTSRDVADQYEVFRIDHPDVLALIEARDDEGGRRRLSFARLWPYANKISEQAELANKVPAKKRNGYQQHLLKLVSQMNLYIELRDNQRPYAVAPLRHGEQWQPMAAAMHAAHRGQTPPESAQHLGSAFSAYQRSEPERFNAALDQYRQVLDNLLPTETRRARFEVFFNVFAPFYHGIALYTLAFVLACAALVTLGLGGENFSRTLGRAAVFVLLLTLAVHTFGLGARIYIQGRPPVTNLYSSAVFIGWGAVILALVGEWVMRLHVGTIVAAVIGLISLIIAHNLGNDGDTMQMMQAVLDTNFWLATHVIAVTIGYVATFVAGVMAILFLLLGLLTRFLTPQRFRMMGKVIYGVICFAVLWSFVGTVLGGIWADQSWGRFWGWDPKENGAVLIVLMCALILHARWAGMIRERGVAVLSVVGNIVTAWSWFGTNMLGVGLHSYGFMNAAMWWLIIFAVSQLMIVAIGLTPLRYWRSMATPQPQDVSISSAVAFPAK